MENLFTDKLMYWHSSENKRIMPWKGEKDPYKVWVSEIILQQTRVMQGMTYYNNFIQKFPTIQSLASAPQEEVFKAWEGLGYYTRCKNLIVTAKKINDDLGGVFPETYEKILELKGIGPYTAAAISSFAYGLPHAVVDGNVLRVIARYFGDALPIDSTKGKAHYSAIANKLLSKNNPAAYNQAIMDFGATICKPQIAECHECVLQQTCAAFNSGMVNKLPVKEKRVSKKRRWFTYFMFFNEDGVLINKRELKDIWENLHEFYLFETDNEWHFNQQELEGWLHNQLQLTEFTILNISKKYKQQLTHQLIQATFITVTLSKVPASLKNFQVVSLDDLRSKAFPRLINHFIEEEEKFFKTRETLLQMEDL